MIRSHGEKPHLSTAAPSVAVCALTCERPKGLMRLVAGLNKLTFQNGAPALTVVIVNNGPVRDTENELRANLSWPLRYVIEPRRGIAIARNTALNAAVDHHDFIAFIDDDEVPEPQWLDELLTVQSTHHADVVTGPVLSRLDSDTPAWVSRGGFFDRPRHPTGFPVDCAFTGNVLISSQVFKETGFSFDERLALVGGEDRHLFQRIFEAGYRMIWADRAVVHEWTPGSRTSLGWILRRSFRAGNAMAYSQSNLHPGLRRGFVLVCKGLVCQAIGVGVATTSVVRGRHVAVRGAWYICYGLGLIAGVAGKLHEEYRTIDGD